MISIIVPVYNSEKFLKKCLDSICCQTYKDWELIAVDDGSTDSSISILKEYQNKNKRIKIISQQNSGPAVARNAGLKNAKGEYIFFIDSDDSIDGSLLEELYNFLIVNDCDIVQSGLCYEMDKIGLIPKIKKKYGKEGILPEYTAMAELIEQTLIKNFVWGKLFKRSVIGDTTFPNQMLYEDFYWIQETMSRCNRYGFINEPRYFYKLHEESLTGNIKAINECFLKANKDRLEFIETKYPSLYKTMKKRYDRYRILASGRKNAGLLIIEFFNKIKDRIFYPYDKVKIID